MVDIPWRSAFRRFFRQVRISGLTAETFRGQQPTDPNSTNNHRRNFVFFYRVAGSTRQPLIWRETGLPQRLDGNWRDAQMDSLRFGLVPRFFSRPSVDRRGSIPYVFVSSRPPAEIFSDVDL